MVGTERVLLALAEDPDWMVDMWHTELETELALLDMVWEAGYTFDSILWYDDMGYKYNQFFSMRMYRNLLKPFHQRAIDWAHAKGIKAHLHSCGDVRPFVPELVEMGLDALNPLEVKAGMDPVLLKQQFGERAGLPRRGQRGAVGPARGDPGRDGARHPGDEGERRVYLLLRPLRALQRQPGGFPPHRGTRQGIG